MYKEDCPLIANYALQSPANLFRVGLFVQSTIKQHLEQVPRLVASFDRYAFGTKAFMGWQKSALKVLLSEQERLHTSLRKWRRQGRNAPHQAIRTIVELPGFGIVKAAFFAQLLLPWTHVGCLDRHNLRLYGLSETAFKRVPASAEGLTRKINTYLGLCKELGGAAPLWDRWCAHVSQLRPKVFPTPDHVSKLHVQCIVR